MQNNLLENPGFEGAFRNWKGESGIRVAAGWYPFWLGRAAHEPEWRNQQPTYSPARRSENVLRVLEGDAAQMVFTSWSTHTAGLLQTVAVPLGSVLRFAACGHAWSSDADDSAISEPPDNVAFRIGLDPSGGTNPLAASIVWSSPRAVHDAYDRGFSVEATAASDRVTVFLLSEVLWPRKHNQVYWDSTSLVILPEIVDSLDEALPGGSADKSQRWVLIPPLVDPAWGRAVQDVAVSAEEDWRVYMDVAELGAEQPLPGGQVIVINPPAWPAPIVPYLEDLYPGLQVIPVTAVSPDDLTRALREVLSHSVT